MTLRDLIEEIRDKLDDTSQPYLWSDNELVRYINRAVNRLAAEAYLITDGTTESVGDSSLCKISLSSADGAHYDKHSSIIKVRYAQYSDGKIIWPVSLDWLNEYYPTWRAATADKPRYLTEDFTTGKITFIPAPDTDYTVYLTVYRLPLTPLSLASLSGTPEIPARYHSYIIPGVLAEAYLKQDAETFDKRLAVEYQALFESKIRQAFRENYTAISVPYVVAPHQAFI